MIENTQMHEIRSIFNRAYQSVEAVLRGHTSHRVSNPSQWRRRPNGPLNDSGVREIYRRFAAGRTDGEIAIAMDVTPSGVFRRRLMWIRSSRQ